MMRRIPLAEVKRRFAKLQVNHQNEITEAVTRYCEGNTPEFVADALGVDAKWVRSQLKWKIEYGDKGFERRRRYKSEFEPQWILKNKDNSNGSNQEV